AGGRDLPPRLIRPQRLPSDRIYAILAEHEDTKAVGGEQSGECAIENVEATGIGAERRHDEPVTVADKASPSHPAPATGDRRCRVQMSGDLAPGGRRRRRVTEGKRPGREAF